MTMTLNLDIDGMHCGSCALLIDDALADLPGVRTSRTSVKTRRSTVTVESGGGGLAEIIRVVEDLGYGCRPAHS